MTILTKAVKYLLEKELREIREPERSEFDMSEKEVIEEMLEENL